MSFKLNSKKCPMCAECQEKLFGNVDKSKFVEGDEIYVYSEF